MDWYQGYLDSPTPPKDVRFSIYSRRIWDQFCVYLSPSLPILDLGCGGGTVLMALEARGYTKLHGCDYVCASKNHAMSATIDIGDVCATPYTSASFHAIVSTMTLEHVDDRAMLQEVNRLLQSYGYALITTVMRTKAWYWHRNTKGERVLHPDHRREYASINEYCAAFPSGLQLLHYDTPLIKYPITDPILRLLRIDPLRAGWLRKLRVPIPCYRAIEGIWRKV